MANRAIKTSTRTTESILAAQEKQANATRENAVVKASSTALAPDNSNPWIEVSAELDKFVGAPYVRFSKAGAFEISESETIPAGTKCIAHVDEVAFGWRKWQGNRLVETRMGRVADRFVPAQRGDLGNTDPDEWEAQDDGTPRDPWQFCASLPLTRLDTGESYVFSVSSKGGQRAVNGLTRTYGSRIRAKGDSAGLPIVELQPDAYKHKQYGKIFFPVLHIVNWTDAAGRPLSAADDLEDAIPEFGGKAA
jgi:hypothetical protein